MPRVWFPAGTTDEVWVIMWYASTVADCDYTSMAHPTPKEPLTSSSSNHFATLALNNTVSDRDATAWRTRGDQLRRLVQRILQDPDVR